MLDWHVLLAVVVLWLMVGLLVYYSKNRSQYRRFTQVNPASWLERLRTKPPRRVSLRPVRFPYKRKCPPSVREAGVVVWLWVCFPWDGSADFTSCQGSPGVLRNFNLAVCPPDSDISNCAFSDPRKLRMLPATFAPLIFIACWGLGASMTLAH
jgi:hypothetical protein